MRGSRVLLTTPILVLLGACATPSTRIAPADASRVRAEEELQRELVLHDLVEEQGRLDALAFPIMVSGTELCGEKTSWQWGFRHDHALSHEAEWRTAARAAGIGDSLTVVGVAPDSPADVAGLRVGDRILSIDGSFLPDGKKAMKAAAKAMKKAREREGDLQIEVLRDAQVIALDLSGIRACSFGHLVTTDPGINAFANGQDVLVTLQMMRTVDDAELQVVIGHEVAHNAMGHLRAKKKNTLLGGLLGGLGDVAAASFGIDTGGFFTEKGMSEGSQAFSQEFEREADYVGLYLVARAGLPLEPALNLWRHFGQLDPSSIAYASSHPTSSERFVLLEQAISEIERKEAEGLPLLPNRESDDKKSRGR
jgi:hypothetical protein